MAEQYIVVPGTQQKIYEGTIVILNRLPNLQWIIHNGWYNYGGARRNGWYLSSIPADSQMPVYNEDLVNLRIVDCPYPPIPPTPPGPCPPVPPGPYPPTPPAPPVPIPVPFTPADKRNLDAAMITVSDIYARDKLSGGWLINGKIVRVNDGDGEGHPEYYSWNSKEGKWEEASLGYRYMTRHEIEQAIGDDIVSIEWADSYGALVITNNGGTEVAPVQLTGVAHDPVFTEENLTLRIPIYGQPDFKMTIPRDMYIRAIRFEAEYPFEEPTPHIGPAVVATVSNGDVEYDIAGDATGFYSIYTGGETATTKVTITTATSQISCNVKLSSIENNPLKVDAEGMWVDLSGVVDKQQMEAGLLLVSDGNGKFTYGGNKLRLDTVTPISQLEHPEQFVVSANLVSQAIVAAIDAYDLLMSQRIEGIETRISAVEGRVSNIEDRIGIVEDNMANISAELTSVQDDVTAVVSEMADVQSIVSNVESQVSDIQSEVSGADEQINQIEERIDFGEGSDDEILLTSGNGLSRSGYKISDAAISVDADDTLPTAKAVAEALSWINF